MRKKTMHPMAARALLAMQLSPEQREKLKVFVKRIPPQRYLQGWEICRMFNLSPKPAPEEETEQLKLLYEAWERRILWKMRSLEAKKHESICLQKLCVCKAREEEIHDWEDWAINNFGKKAEEMSWKNWS